MALELVPRSGPDPYDTCVSFTLSRLDRPNSRIAYTKALTAFRGWLMSNGGTFTWERVNAYRDELLLQGLSPNTINLRLCAIRKFAESLWLANIVPQDVFQKIKAGIKNVKTEGVKVGTWLTKEQMQSLLDAPALSKRPKPLKILRDRAMLAVLMGCGVRREELCSLTIEHFRKIKNVWTIADMSGKGNKRRTIPMGDWCAVLVQEWIDAIRRTNAAYHNGLPLFSCISQTGILKCQQMTEQNVYELVKKYGKVIEVDITPHDLRRSFARLADESGAKLTQISLSLGHSDTKTTLLYLGGNQSYTESAGQSFSLEVSREPNS